MLKWLAKCLATWLRPYLLEVLGSAVIPLDKDKRYMLFLPNDQNAQELRDALTPWRDQIDLVIILSERFNLVEL